MFEDFPCALTPAERKALASALGKGFGLRPLTGVTGLLTVIGAVAACALLFCATYLMERLHHGTGLTLFWCGAYMCAVFLLHRRDALIKKLYAYITSADGTDVPSDPLSNSQS